MSVQEKLARVSNQNRAWINIAFGAMGLLILILNTFIGGYNTEATLPGWFAGIVIGLLIVNGLAWMEE